MLLIIAKVQNSFRKPPARGLQNTKMKHGRLKFAIFGNVHQSEKSASISELLRVIRRIDSTVAIEKNFYHYIHKGLGIDFEPDELIEGNDFTANFAVSLGGDGTFLGTAAQVGNKEIPIIGVNTGRLGFLADVARDGISEAFESLRHGEYYIERRSLLNVKASMEPFINYPYALNEVAVLKHDNSSMISIDAYIDDTYLATYQADGLLVSTPTGSTGYSLSVGGPIIAPTSHTVVITPVAAHSLNVRPIVLDDNITIKLAVRSRNHNFLTSIDGRSQSCSELTTLKIRKAPYSIFVVKKNNTQFFDTLRNKLMWGADKRS